MEKKELLQLFVSYNPYREWMFEPFTVKGHTGATDGSIILLMEGEYRDYTALSEEYSERVFQVIPPENLNFPIPVADLVGALSRTPEIEEVTYQDQECDACDGDGEVEWEFDHKHRSYNMEYECPVCKGSGNSPDQKETTTGLLIMDPEAVIQIKECRLLVGYIEKLLKVAEFHLADEVVLVSQTGPSSPSLFKVATTRVLIMPRMHGDKDTVVHRFE